MRLISMGEQLGFGVLDPVISAARTSQGLQAQQTLQTQKQQNEAGLAVGMAVSEMLSAGLRNRPGLRPQA